MAFGFNSKYEGMVRGGGLGRKERRQGVHLYLFAYNVLFLWKQALATALFISQFRLPAPLQMTAIDKHPDSDL